MVDHQGPCDPWAALSDVRGCGPCADEDAYPDEAVERWLLPASQYLWAATGRQFQGVCEDTVRPVGVAAVGRSPMGFRDASGTRRVGFGFCTSREVALRAPVRSVTSVHVDGVELATNAYEVVDRQYLRRVDGQAWPTRQDMNVAGTAEGAFQVVYTWGADPPDLCVQAAAALVCELVRACSPSGDDECQLNRRIVSVARAGLTYQLPGLADQLDRGLTGVPVVDLAVRAFNPTGSAQPTTIINPDQRARLRRRT